PGLPGPVDCDLYVFQRAIGIAKVLIDCIELMLQRVDFGCHLIRCSLQVSPLVQQGVAGAEEIVGYLIIVCRCGSANKYSEERNYIYELVQPKATKPGFLHV